jgi:hypothetical protein
VRPFFKLLALAAVAALLFYLSLGEHGRTRHESRATARPSGPSAVLRVGESWGNPATLPDHFARHGSDFGAASAEDYARLAWQFLQRAKAEGLPAKVDPTGTLRVYDPANGAFAAYNRDGTTKTFFKPGSPSYFDRQPGRPVNLKTWR